MNTEGTGITSISMLHWDTEISWNFTCTIRTYRKESETMTILRPFRAVRPAPELAAAIAALPYDVYDRAEAKQIVTDNPLSFLKIDRAETQFPDDVDPYSDQVYDRARLTFQEMLQAGHFLRDEAPCFYLYALTMNGRTQTGIVGCASIDDYQNGVIRRHENTRPEKEQDRIRHIDALSAQTGPIFLAYRQDPQLQKLTAAVTASPPAADFTSADGVRHQVWKIADPSVCDAIRLAFAGIEHIYIADGHHRAASAVKVGLQRRAEDPGLSPDAESQYFLSVLFPAEELKIYDYNRVVEDLNGYSPETLLAKLKKDFVIEPCGQSRPTQKGQISMYCGGSWYRLTARFPVCSGDPVRDLDVSVLQDTVLAPLLGIEDPRTDSRIRFIGGIRGLEELVRLVDEKPGRIAFAMYPTSMEELLAVADAGLLMPPKSTWFEPKLRSGLFIHEF